MITKTIICPALSVPYSAKRENNRLTNIKERKDKILIKLVLFFLLKKKLYKKKK